MSLLPTSSSAISLTAAATLTSLLQLTTPFAQPPTCTEIFTTTSIVSSFFWSNYTTTTIRVLVSHVADARFAACQPSGWDSVIPESRFSFSPAVCPSGWTAYILKESAYTVSTAYCCDRDYRLRWPISDLSIDGVVSPACFRDIRTTSPPKPSAWVEFPNGIQVHNAWHISWVASDTSTLSPPPPNLACSFTLSTWVPGETVRHECVDPYNSGVKISQPFFLFLVVGLPLILLAIITSLCVCCIRYHRQSRRQRKARKQRETSAAQGSS